LLELDKPLALIKIHTIAIVIIVNAYLVIFCIIFLLLIKNPLLNYQCQMKLHLPLLSGFH
jgi:hypothetical protein